MAGENTYASIGDLATAEVLSADYLLLRSDPGNLPNHPALHYAGSIVGRGSNTIKVPHLGLNGYNSLAQVGDGSSVSNTAITDASTTVVVARQSLAREVTDLASMVRPDILSQQNLANDAFQAYGARFTDMICDVIDGFTNYTPSTGTNMDLSIFLAALGTARGLYASGPWMTVLHTKQWSDLIQDAGLTAGGALQWLPATAEMITLKTSSYQGAYLGVDVFATPRVLLTNASVDRAGAIFSKGAVCWADGAVAVTDPTEQFSLGGQVLFERKRLHDFGSDQWISHAYLGMGKGVEHGVTIPTKAA